jgi:hypothetical protein
MWPFIRNALLRPQAIVVLALLFLVTDALLAIFSPASAAGHPDRLHPTSFARDCVPPAGNFQQPLPTTDLPALKRK